MSLPHLPSSKLFGRILLGVSLLAGCSQVRAPGTTSSSSSSGSSHMAVTDEFTGDVVPVYLFNVSGELVGPVAARKLVLSDAEWQKRLTREEYEVSRGKGTERAFCGTLLDNKKHGVYACVGCKLPLFSSSSKFNSGTGWPSFYQPIAEGNILEHTDRSHGMDRVEILCARCDGHLGHVFDDGPPPTGRRYCLNSASLKFTQEDDVKSLADPVANNFGKESKPMTTNTPDNGDTKTATFAGGCFWCTEAAFEPLKGVLDVSSGYAGGKKETATYDQVSTGQTGHAEVIRIEYDPKVISYEKLVEVFFDSHDPTQKNRQGNDIGTQYRSAIFYASADEKKIAEARIRELNEHGALRGKIATTLEPLVEFYPAEQYHQDYARLNPKNPYIQHHALPKAADVAKKHADLLKDSQK